MNRSSATNFLIQQLFRNWVKPLIRKLADIVSQSSATEEHSKSRRSWSRKPFTIIKISIPGPYSFRMLFRAAPGTYSFAELFFRYIGHEPNDLYSYLPTTRPACIHDERQGAGACQMAYIFQTPVNSHHQQPFAYVTTHIRRVSSTRGCTYNGLYKN